MKKLLMLLWGMVVVVGCASGPSPAQTTEPAREYPIKLSDQEWRSKLTPQQYHVLRQKGTERAFTGKYADHHENGDYLCAGCGEPLFASKHKFESGTGWPSFYSPYNETCVAREVDNSYGWRRIEVVCANCGGHLGHVFEDGPKPTGLRYCINSASLQFRPGP